MEGICLSKRYQIEKKIGQGGMGIVYLARDLLLDRLVAVKVLKQSAFGTEGHARFLSEVKNTAKLNHPNIVTVFDAGEHEGQLFLIMELIDGKPISQARPENLEAICHLVEQICQALVHAHAHGIIHRDIKPENVMQCADGNARLMDFGIARSTASQATEEGTYLGTLSYISPEQAMGGAMDERADLYSLGVLMYELLTGQLPFESDAALGVITQHLHAPVVPPRTKNPDIPPALDTLVVELMSKSPDDRPASASEVLERLETARSEFLGVGRSELLEIKLLGRFEVIHHGKAVSIASRPDQNLLAYLFLYPDKTHRRERLAGLLWPESDETNARKYLSQSLWRLRKVLGDTYFQVDKVSVGLNPEAEFHVDAAHLQQLNGGSLDALMDDLSVYQGRLLPGFYLDWVATEAEILHGIYERGLQKLLDGLLEAGRWDDAIQWGERWLALGDLPETAFRALMFAYAGLGDRAGAVAVYRRCVAAFQDELEIEPSEETQQLYARICQGNLEKIAKKSTIVFPEEPGRFVRPPNPYRGLYAFREEDAELFFGREAMTQRVLEAVNRKPFLALVGPSGSGKSSVVFAGVLPRLRQQEAWLPVTFRPGSHPFSALAGALVPLLSPALSDSRQLKDTQKLGQDLSAGEIPLFEVIEQILKTHPEKRRVLLVADQFEELYTLVPEPESRRKFLDNLLHTIQIQQFRATPAFVILLTLRADFFGRVVGYRPMADALQDADILLGPMSLQELTQAIAKPAEARGFTFETGLVKRILDDVAEEPGYLPLLEFALTTLWRGLTSQVVTHAAYDAIGRVEGALSCYADEVFDRLGLEDQVTCQRLFIQMVRPGDGTEDTRRLANKTEVGEDNWPLIHRLADARLVVTGRDAAGQETVEIVHEALISGWGRLRAWMTEARAFRSWQERLRASIQQWEANEKDEGALLRGVALAEAEDWLSKHGSEISAPEKDFIQAALERRQQAQAEKEKQDAERERLRTARERMRRFFNIGLTASLLITITLVIFAGWQWSLARQSLVTVESERDRASAQTTLALQRLSSQLAARVLNIYEDQLDLALLLSLEAYQMADTFEARSSMQVALTHNPMYVTRIWGESEVRSVALRPDGQLAAAGYEDGSLILWDIATAKPAARLEGHSAAVRGLAFHPDGTMLLSGGADNRLYLWDLEAEPPQKTRLEGPADQVLSVVFAPDGQTVAAGGKDHTIRIWDVRTGQPLGAPMILEDWVQALAFRPDGQVLAAGSCAARSSMGLCQQGEIRLWDVASGKPIRQPVLTHNSTVASLAFHPDGKTLASGGSFDDSVLVWDLPADLRNFGDEAPLALVGNQAGTGTTGLAFRGDGETLVSASKDNVLIQWDLNGRTPVGQALTGHQGAVSSVAFSARGDLLASGSEDHSIIIWNMMGGQPLGKPIPDIPDSFIEETILGAVSDRWVALRNKEGEIFLVDLTNPDEPGRLIVGHEAPLVLLLISQDNQRLGSLSEDGVVKLWDIETGLQVGQGLTGQLHRDFLLCGGAGDIAPTFQMSPDSRFLASADETGTITILDMETGLPLHAQPPRQGGEVRSLAFSPEGEYLVSGGENGEVIIWAVESGTVLLQPDPVQVGEAVWVIASPNGEKILSASKETLAVWDGVLDSETFGQPLGDPISKCIGWLGPDFHTYAGFQKDYTLQFWDLDTMQPLGAPSEEPVIGSFGNTFTDPERKLMGTIDNVGVLTLWDIENGTQLYPALTGDETRIIDGVFSPDGTHLVAIDVDRRGVLWDTATGSALGELLEGSGEKITGIRFSPDGKVLALGSETGRVFLWDLEGGRSIGNPLPGHERSAFFFFSPDGNLFLSISKDAAYFWDFRTAIWAEKACYRANRNMTSAEWRQFFGDEPYRKTCPALPGAEEP